MGWVSAVAKTSKKRVATGRTPNQHNAPPQHKRKEEKGRRDKDKFSGGLCEKGDDGIGRVITSDGKHEHGQKDKSQPPSEFLQMIPKRDRVVFHPIGVLAVLKAAMTKPPAKIRFNAVPPKWLAPK